MVPKEVRERAAVLRKAINQYRYDYHVLDRETISASALDSLKHELSKVEVEYPELITPDSPTQRVAGKPLPKFKKIKHEVAQWSFNDAFDETEIREFDARVKKVAPKATYVCELKIDGLKVVLTYKKGILETAVTRGDGEVGEDVTHNVRTIESVPLVLREPVDVIVEGEVWLGKKELARINVLRKKEGEPEFANPRNAAAGSIRQLDASVAAARKLDTFIYDVAKAGSVPDTQFKELLYLKGLGFKVNSHAVVATDINGVITFWKKWGKKKDDEDYLIDGVVVKVNERRMQESLGYTGKAPRFGIAFKFAAEQVTTVLEGIQFQVGRTGVVTPVAHLRPVNVAGVMVSRATLHNEDQIKRLDVRVGDTVVLQRAGDVIPEVVEVVKGLRPKNARVFEWPKTIAACGEDGRIERVPGMAAWRCVSKTGHTILLRRLSHFVSRNAMNIEHLGPKSIEQFLDEGLVSEFADFFALKASDLEGLEGWQEKSAENLIAAISDRKKVPLERLLFALGIEQVGEETARDLASHFRTLEKIRSAEVSQLIAVPNIAEKVATSITSWFKDKQHARELDALLKYVTVQNGEKKAVGKLLGKTFVITGTLEEMSREEAEAKIRAAGGSVSGSVSSKTSFVVVGSDPGSKAVKAKELGVNILTESAFLKMI